MKYQRPSVGSPYTPDPKGNPPGRMPSTPAPPAKPNSPPPQPKK
jgi:hypothetical protein